MNKMKMMNSLKDYKILVMKNSKNSKVKLKLLKLDQLNSKPN